MDSLWGVLSTWLRECVSLTKVRVYPPSISFYENFQAEHYTRDSHVEITPKLTELSDAEGFDPTFSSPSDLFGGTFYNGITTWLASILNPSMQSSNIQQKYNAKNGHFIYRDAFVMGSPDLTMYNSAIGSLYSSLAWCSSMNMPYTTYYSSAIDRSGWTGSLGLEELMLVPYQTISGSINDVGAIPFVTPFSGMGSTIARTGWTEGASESNSAVIAALRAMSITAENRAMFNAMTVGHIPAMPMVEFASGSWTAAQSYSYRTPQHSGAFKLDMIFPYVGAERGLACTRYQQNQELLVQQTLDAAFVAGNTQSAAAFKVWRPIRCCKRKGNHIVTIHYGSKIGYPLGI